MSEDAEAADQQGEIREPDGTPEDFARYDRELAEWRALNEKPATDRPDLIQQRQGREWGIRYAMTALDLGDTVEASRILAAVLAGKWDDYDE